MQIVTTEDNSRKGNPFDQVRESDGGNRRQTFADIQRFANYTIEELLKGNKNLLVFPHCLNDIQDIDRNSVICNLKGSADDLERAVLETGNVMGFVGCNGTELRIRSRFAKNDRNDYFLHYMMQKVFSINVIDVQVGRDDEQIFDFLLYLLPMFLRRALSQGIYREYRWIKRNDDRVRGPIDIGRHLRSNIPFNGRIAYNAREYGCDNRVTQLVRHAIEHVVSTPQAGILKNDQETRDCVARIRGVTPSYNPRDRDRVVSLNYKPIGNPYFSEYALLQKLCISILNHRRLRFGEKRDSIHGVLFDGAWLWEEYLNTFLKEAGFNHPRNRQGTGRWHLFNNNKCPRYPDFFNDSLILDAKYKRLACIDEEDRLNRCVSRDDMHQMISYMHISDKERDGVFIFPDVEDSLGESHLHDIGTLKGFGGKVSLCGFPLKRTRKCENYAEFCKEMAAAEEGVLQDLKR